MSILQSVYAFQRGRWCEHTSCPWPHAMIGSISHHHVSPALVCPSSSSARRCMVYCTERGGRSVCQTAYHLQWAASPWRLMKVPAADKLSSKNSCVSSISNHDILQPLNFHKKIPKRAALQRFQVNLWVQVMPVGRLQGFTRCRQPRSETEGHLESQYKSLTDVYGKCVTLMWKRKGA